MITRWLGTMDGRAQIVRRVKAFVMMALRLRTKSPPNEWLPTCTQLFITKHRIFFINMCHSVRRSHLKLLGAPVGFRNCYFSRKKNAQQNDSRLENVPDSCIYNNPELYLIQNFKIGLRPSNKFVLKACVQSESSFPLTYLPLLDTCFHIISCFGRCWQSGTLSRK